MMKNIFKKHNHSEWLSDNGEYLIRKDKGHYELSWQKTSNGIQCQTLKSAMFIGNNHFNGKDHLAFD